MQKVKLGAAVAAALLPLAMATPAIAADAGGASSNAGELIQTIGSSSESSAETLSSADGASSAPSSTETPSSASSAASSATAATDGASASSASGSDSSAVDSADTIDADADAEAEKASAESASDGEAVETIGVSADPTADPTAEVAEAAEASDEDGAATSGDSTEPGSVFPLLAYLGLCVLVLFQAKRDRDYSGPRYTNALKERMDKYPGLYDYR